MTTFAPSKRVPLAISQRIQVRQMDNPIPADVPKFWFNNNPVLTAMLAAFSVGFPAGERFFMDSVRHFQAAITDPVLQDEIRGFIGQEAQHTKQHVLFNQFLDERGYPATFYAETARKVLTKLQARSTPAANLARTAALEHFTAILADAMLGHPEVMDQIHPSIAKLWVWHAIEEVEHRNVAFDVYKQVVDDEALRLREMMLITVGFITTISLRTVMMQVTTGAGFQPKAFKEALNTLWGKPGIFRKAIPQYFAYYRKDFHPSQHDNSHKVEAAKKRWLAEYEPL